VEIIASALLPFMILSGRKKSWVIATGFGLFIFACLPLGLHNYWNFFMLDFFMGASILLWGRAFAQKFADLPSLKFWLAIAAMFLVFYLPRIILAYDYDANFFHLFEMFAIVAFVAVVFYVPVRFKALTKTAYQYLGDISYSLYLTHSITLILIANAFAQVPFMMEHRYFFSGVFVLIGIPASLFIAHLTYRYVEIPGIALGKRLIKS
jgi:peptidoglycan/LPS O-acetylase OafA/YrhL